MAEDGTDAGFLAFQEKAKGANINEQTLLATDYLNHFNEIIMIMEMVPDMPEILEEAQEWRPKTYQEHFRDSAFTDKDLAIEAYDHVPAKHRQPFEQTIEQMNGLVASTLARLEQDVASGDAEVMRLTATNGSQLLQRLMDHASGIIHGGDKTMQQDEIDAMLG